MWKFTEEQSCWRRRSNSNKYLNCWLLPIPLTLPGSVFLFQPKYTLTQLTADTDFPLLQSCSWVTVQLQTRNSHLTQSYWGKDQTRAKQWLDEELIQLFVGLRKPFSIYLGSLNVQAHINKTIKPCQHIQLDEVKVMKQKIITRTC